jgi:uncharacterized protein (TIGR03067 family)
MKVVVTWPSKNRRAGVMACVALVLVIASYAISRGLHRSASWQVDEARAHIARAEWLDAIRCLDKALWADRYLLDAYLLRATAINEHLASIDWKDRVYSREDALADLDWYLRYRPDSGEAHHQRGRALSGLAKVGAAREELARAIALLDDPTDALVERASLSFHVDDREAAVREITAAIERHPLVPDYYEARALYRRFASDPRGAQRDEVRAALLRESKDLSVEELEARLDAQFDDRPVTEPQDSPALSAERARFAGKWKVIAREQGGESVDTTDLDFSMTFEADRYRLVVDGRTKPVAPFWLDMKRQPRRIDWMATIDGKEQRLLGIYEFRGDNLLICMGNAGEARPATLSTAGRNGVVLYTLRRIGRP